MQIALLAETSDPYSAIHLWLDRKVATERAAYVRYGVPTTATLSVAAEV